MAKRKTEKPVVKDRIYINDVLRVDAAMKAGIEIVLLDKTIWRCFSFTIGKLSLFGEFTRHED